MEEVDLNDLKNYAAEDADLTFQLYLNFNKIKALKLDFLFEKVEMPLKVLHDMEKEGIKINTSSLLEFSEKLKLSLTDLEKSIYKHSEIEFNIDSPKQLGEILFGKLMLDDKAKNKNRTI